MKYVLGSGINALIFAYYNKDYTCIGEDFGNLVTLKNTILFHDSEYTKKLLTELNVEYSYKTSKISYLENGVFLEDLTKDQIVKFIRKKLDDPNAIIVDFTLSVKSHYIKTLEFDYEDLINSLKANVKIIKDTIIAIDGLHIITKSRYYEYDRLVNTLPVNTYNKLIGESYEYKYKSVTFCVTEILPNDEYSDINYILDSNNLTRINKKDNTLLWEFTGDVDINLCKSIVNRDIINYKVVNNAIVISEFAKSNLYHLHLGRFAQHNHQLKIHDTIEFSLNFTELSYIFNAQKNFTSNFVDFSKDDINYKITNAIKYINLIYPEVSELVSCLPYKEHKKIELDLDNALEECIDVLKYLINTFLVLGFTEKMLVTKFYDKSIKVKNRYELEKHKNSM